MSRISRECTHLHQFLDHYYILNYSHNRNRHNSHPYLLSAKWYRYRLESRIVLGCIRHPLHMSLLTFCLGKYHYRYHTCMERWMNISIPAMRM